MSMNTTTFAGLREYYYLSSLILWNANGEFDDHLEEKTRAILDKWQEANELDNPSYSAAFHEIDVQYTLMLRYAMLPRFLALLERRSQINL